VTWEEIAALHDSAANDLAAAAVRVPADRWLAARAEGKWSPAEVVEHLNLVYDVLLRELDGGAGMQLRTKWWQRVMLRFTILPKILRGDGFPVGARAPKETRPVLSTTDQRELIARFRERASRFAAVTAAGRSKRITHAYFGAAKVPESVLLVARHIEHHTKQL
jgi:DinB family protein